MRRPAAQEIREVRRMDGAERLCLLGDIRRIADDRAWVRVGFNTHEKRFLERN